MAKRTTHSGIRRHRPMTLLSVALFSASILLAAFLVSRRVPTGRPEVLEPVVVAQFDTVALPVPVAGVSAGVRVKDMRFKTVTFPRHQVPPGALTELSSVLESVTTASIPANLPLFAENFSANFNPGNPVIQKIPEGMRAMTIRVDATAAVEGLAGSGALVDVLLIAKDRTSVVAEKVKILSAERSVSPVEGNATPNVPSTVTLLVTQEQCLAINTAIPMGKIAFALRAHNDDQSWGSTLYTADRLRGGPVARDKPASVTGVVSIKGSERHWALSDGRWIKTESMPQGFLIGDARGGQ